MENMEKEAAAGAGNPGAGAQSTEEQNNEKMFTQADVDRIVSERLSRERRKKADTAGGGMAEETENAGTGQESGENPAVVGEPKSWEERFGEVLKDNDYGLSADDMLLVKAFNLDRNGEIDGLALAKARGEAYGELAKSGKLIPASDGTNEKRQGKLIDSVMRKAFGLRAK